MTNEQRPQQLGSKVDQVYQIIGKKWTCPIIHALMDKPKRFSEILSYIPDLSKRMLNERMKEMETCGIILRNVTQERPVRIEYSLTRKGHELGEALNHMESWADKWL